MSTFSETWTLQQQFQYLFKAGIDGCRVLITYIPESEFAAKAAALGYLDEPKMTAMYQRLDQAKPGDKFKVTTADILLLYTSLDLAAKSYLTFTGDETTRLLSGIYDQNEVTNRKDYFLAASSHLLQGFSKVYKHLPEFKTRSKKLEELNSLL